MSTYQNPPTSPEHEHALIEAVAHLVKTLSQNSYASDDFLAAKEEKATNNLKGFNANTLRRVATLTLDPQETNEFLYILESQDWTKDEPSFNDLLSVAKDLPADPVLPNYMIRGLHHYQGVCPQEQNAEYPEERRDQINALFRITRHLVVKLKVDSLHVEGDAAQYYIKDDALSAFIINPGEGYRRDEITDFILTRNITDADTIKEMLTDAIPAIREGVL